MFHYVIKILKKSKFSFGGQVKRYTYWRAGGPRIRQDSSLITHVFFARISYFALSLLFGFEVCKMFHSPQNSLSHFKLTA